MSNLFWSMELNKRLLMECNTSGLIQSENTEPDANLWRDVEAYVFSERNISERIISFLSIVSLFHALLQFPCALNDL
jgi:hypothetical protein